MVLSFTFQGKAKNVLFSSGKYKLSYPCSSKETCFPYESYFPAGKYHFEVHGAAGGSTNEAYTAAGGFSNGTILLKTQTHLYFYVGAKGVCKSNTPEYTTNVFGGGGKGRGTEGGKPYGHNSYVACSGGGASDIRIGKDLLSHRIIVAGGSGGYGYESKDNRGGDGGYESGTKGDDGNTNAGHCIGGGPGNQSSGGTSYVSNNAGAFGFGGNVTSGNGGGGGGGWFGGGASYGCESAGGGGSGFVFTKKNSRISLDSKYLLLEGETSFGTNKNDGFIYIQQIENLAKRAVKVIKNTGADLISKIFGIFLISN